MSDPAPSSRIESANGDGSLSTLDTAPGGVAVAERPARSSSTQAVCPYFHQAVELVGKRWTGAVVDALLPGSRRFSEIALAIPQISDRLLSIRLRELEAEGIVERHVLDGSPVRVEYDLTQKGRALEPALHQLACWAREWLPAS
jgi:DNA-binding HxlR family transcriptional regulator